MPASALVLRKDVLKVRQEDGLPYWWRVAWVRPGSPVATIVILVREGRSASAKIATLEAAAWQRTARHCGPVLGEIRPPFWKDGKEWRPITRRPKLRPHGLS